MRYQRADQVLPPELLERVQQYVDGQCLYIPRKSGEKRAWGETTEIRQELKNRNQAIYQDRCLQGLSYRELAKRYFLSEKSIQRILSQEKSKSMRAGA